MARIPPEDDFSTSIDRALASVLRYLEVSPELVRQLVERLEEHPLLCNANRYAEPRVVEFLIGEAERERFASPQLSARHASLAYRLAVAHPKKIPATLRVHATAELANANRLLGDFHAAMRFMKEALAEVEEIADRKVRPHVYSLAASLYHDERRNADGFRVIEAALADYRRLRDRRNVGKVLLQLARCHFQDGCPESALEVTIEAHGELLAAGDRQLAFVAVHNSATYELLAGRPLQALKIIDDLDPLYPKYGNGEHGRIKQLWIRGQIMFSLYENEAARDMLSRVRDEMVRRGQVHDVALASIDLAGALSDLGELAEVVRIGTETYSLASAAGADLDALAAVAQIAEVGRKGASLAVAASALNILGRSHFGKPLAGREFPAKGN